MKRDSISALCPFQIRIPNNTIEIKPEEYGYRRGNRLAAFDAAGRALVDTETTPELSLRFVSGDAGVAKLRVMHGYLSLMRLGYA